MHDVSFGGVKGSSKYEILSLYFFCSTQMKLFWRMLIINPFWLYLTYIVWTKHWDIYKKLFFWRKKSYRLETTWGWVKDDSIFIFCWTISLSCHILVCFLAFSCLIWVVTLHATCYLFIAVMSSFSSLCVKSFQQTANGIQNRLLSF